MRPIRLFALLVALSLAPASALAQAPADPPAPGSDESGRPVDGYILTALFAFGALFVVAKSARRS